HQADPNSWDMTHGRIYKIQPSGTKSTPLGDLSKKSSAELVELLKNNNPWWHRTALRLLKERRDSSVSSLLEDLVFHAPDARQRLRGLWGLYAIGAFEEGIANKLLMDANSWVRVWTIRLLGESSQVSAALMKRLVELASHDKAPEVRLQLA